MNIADLKAELTDDPLGRGYSGMSDAEAATSLNTVNLFRDRTTMTGSEVFNAFDAAEWSRLSNADTQQVWNVLHLGVLDPFGLEATVLIGAFGSGSLTIVALANARKEPISRATKLRLGRVRVGDVQRARA